MGNQNFELQKQGFMASERYEELVTLCLINENPNDPASETEIGKSYLLYKPTSPEAVKYFLRAAEAGDTSAMHLLGICCKYGFGVSADPKKAYSYFRRAADLDYTPSAIHAALACECEPSEHGADFCTAFDLYIRAAAAGNAIAQYKVALYYERGNGVAQNFDEAFKWCRAAAMRGNIRAIATLGRYYEVGIGTKPSIQEAMHYYEMASNEKNIPAQYALRRLKPEYPVSKGLALFTEVHGRVFTALSEKYGEENVRGVFRPERSKEPLSLLICGLTADAVKKFCAYAYDVAFECFYKAAVYGIPEALWHTADYFMSGKYAIRNLPFAFELFSRAAEMGYMPAVWALGFFYERGECVPCDMARAVECFERAAEAGYNPAKLSLATLYETGTYFEADFEKAQSYYNSIDRERDILEPWVEMDLSFETVPAAEDVLQYRIYRFEEIRSEDTSKFFGAYGRIAETGNVYAMYRLAHMYEEGTSKSAKRPDRAFFYYKKAAEAGYAPAKSEYERFCAENPTVVAKYYASSESGENNTEKAFELYISAAQAGDCAAMLQTAKCYLEGIGTEKDEDTAYIWACRAKHAGQHVGLDFGRHVITYPDGIDETRIIKYFSKDSGDCASIFSLGCCAEVGFGTEKDVRQAAACYYNASENDYRWAHFAIARFYEENSGNARDLAYAYDRYRTALAESDPLAVHYFSVHYQEYAEKATNSPHDNALVCLIAYCTENGIGTEKNPYGAIEYYRLLAERGYAPAIWLLGRCIENGVAVEKNVSLALDKYREAAQSDFTPAMCDVGRIYETHYQNSAQAVIWYTSAVSKKNADGLYHLGKLVYKTDPEKGLSYVIAAAEKEHAYAQFFVGRHHEEAGDTEKALSWYERASEGDCSDADVRIGMHYIKMQDPADKRVAFEYFSRAAHKGNSDGMLQVAECIARGLGVQKNPIGAVKYYTRAALAGNMYAQYSLGSCYERGFGTEIDLKKAVEYYRMAAEQGHDDAQYALGSCCAKGKGIDQNMQMAVYWYEQALLKDNDKAGVALGICCENGQGGLRIDPERAVTLYRMSAGCGNYIAQYRLGLCYEKGKFVEQDSKQAFGWFLRSAEAGNTIAQFKVGECCFTGFGTDEDVQTAIEWYKRAANGKSADAARKLAWCYENGYGVEKNRAHAQEWYEKAIAFGSKTKKNTKRN